MSFITSPGVIVPPLTAGGVAYGTGSQAKVNSAGTSGQVLRSAGAGVPTWQTSTAGIPVTVPEGGTGLTTLTAKNVILGNGSSAPTFVAPGTTGNLLTSNGTTWQSTTPAVPPTSALILLSTVTASGAATADIENTFNSTYDNYLIVVCGLQPSTGGDALWCRMKLGGAYASGGLDYTYTTNITSAATYSGLRVNGAPQIVLGNDVAATQENQFTLYTSKPTGTTYRKPITWQGTVARQASGSHDGIIAGAGGSEPVTALTGIRIMFSTGTITGTFRLYGIANS